MVDDHDHGECASLPLNRPSSNSQAANPGAALVPGV
jgi:hypothetical protein